MNTQLKEILNRLRLESSKLKVEEGMNVSAARIDDIIYDLWILVEKETKAKHFDASKTY